MPTPGHRVTVGPAAGPVRVARDGVPAAGTARAPVLRARGCTVRPYVPPEDVRTDPLEPSERHTRCPFKGTTSYRSLSGRPDVVWAYLGPKPEVAAVRGYFCFYDEEEG